MNYDEIMRCLSVLNFDICDGGIDINVLWFRPDVMTAGKIITRHCHSSFEIHAVASGKCIVRTDNGEHIVLPGEVYITPPGFFHEQFAAEDHVEYCLNVDVKKIDAQKEQSFVFDALHNCGFAVFADSGKIKELFESAFCEITEKKTLFYSAICNYIRFILYETARLAAPEMPLRFGDVGKANINSVRFEQITRYIEDNISLNLTVADIAAVLYLSEKQINRIIVSSTGFSAKKYILHLKHEKAKEYLRKTSMGISEIAEKLGFSSAAHFCKFFTKYEGYTPSEFRKNTNLCPKSINKR